MRKPVGVAEIDLTQALLSPSHDDPSHDTLRTGSIVELVCPFYSLAGGVSGPPPADAAGRTPVLGVSLSLTCEVDMVLPFETLRAAAARAPARWASEPVARSAAASVPSQELAPRAPPAQPSAQAATATADVRVSSASDAAPGAGDGSDGAAGADEGEDWRVTFRQSDEYRVAMQLELWRYEEEERFKQDLDERMTEVGARRAGRHGQSRRLGAISAHVQLTLGFARAWDQAAILHRPCCCYSRSGCGAKWSERPR